MPTTAEAPHKHEVISSRALDEPRVIISNEYSRFHLAVAAAEADCRGTLAQLITGAYPTTRFCALTSRDGRVHAGIARLLDRDYPRSGPTDPSAQASTKAGALHRQLVAEKWTQC